MRTAIWTAQVGGAWPFSLTRLRSFTKAGKAPIVIREITGLRVPLIDLGGTVPFGWRLGDDGALIEVPEQQAAIRCMLEMRRAGSSLRAIANAMKAEGFELSHVGVRKVIAAAEDRQKQEAA